MFFRQEPVEKLPRPISNAAPPNAERSALRQESIRGTPESMSLGIIKAVAIDVDGTLLDHDHRLRDPVRDALHELVANQTQVILATARGPQALAAVLRPLRLSPLVVCFSGAWVGELDYLSLRPKRDGPGSTT